MMSAVTPDGLKVRYTSHNASGRCRANAELSGERLLPTSDNGDSVTISPSDQP